MATPAKQVRALRDEKRSGVQRFSIAVSQGDLRVMAQHGYEGVLSTDPEQRVRTLSLFITNMLAARRASNGVAPIATAFQ